MIVTGVMAETKEVVAENVTLSAFAGTTTVPGTFRAIELLLVRDTTAPVPWAPLVRITVTSTGLLPTTLTAAGVTCATVGSAGGGGRSRIQCELRYETVTPEEIGIAFEDTPEGR